MNVVRWQPINEMVSLRSAMNKLMEDSFINPASSLYDFNPETAAPIDVYQTPGEVIIKATLPGVLPDDVDITIDGNTLTIKGETKADENVKSEDYLYRERRYGAFHRTVTLPGGLDTNRAEAIFENGILKLRMPKSEEAKPKTIRVKTSTESTAR